MSVDVVELGLDGGDDGQQAGVQALGRDLQPLSLGYKHGDQLTPAGQQGSELLLALVGDGSPQAGQIITTHQHRGHFGEHARIDGVSLGED